MNHPRRLIITSFSHRRGPLHPAPTPGLLFDVRSLPNPPISIRQSHDGTSEALRNHLMADESVRRRLGDITGAIQAHLGRAGEKEEVRAGLCCELGQNRSVACVEELRRVRWPEGWDVQVEHREL
ncbi:hypothetical protein FPV67DRAFT_988064 [Lyophyllum atratum]|nr:hypothetical protein FPV67DRAFT_988064 [Lyophyllum atratum]